MNSVVTGGGPPRETTTARLMPPGTSRGHLIAIAVLLLACYWPTIRVTSEILLFHEDMAHGFFAPIVAAYIAWNRLRDPLTRGLRPTFWAFVPLGLGLVIAIGGTIGASTTFTRFAALLSVSGCVLLAAGGHALRAVAFPLFLLLFTFPIPPVIYGEITMPLQLLASRLAELSFEALGYSVIRDGNVLELANLRLSVIEACSGLRSLETLLFFSLIYAYFLESQRSVQLLIVGAALPAALALNVVRIVLTGILGKINADLTHGFWHELLGWVCLALGFGLVYAVHRIVLRSRTTGSSRA